MGAAEGELNIFVPEAPSHGGIVDHREMETSSVVKGVETSSFHFRAENSHITYSSSRVCWPLLGRFKANNSALRMIISEMCLYYNYSEMSVNCNNSSDFVI